MPPQNNVPTPPQEQTPPVMTPPSMTPPSPFVSQTPIKIGGHKSVWLAVAIVAVVVLGGVAYAYFTEMGPFARPPYNTDKLASEIFNGAGLIDSASYSINVKVVSEPKAADAKPFEAIVPADSDYQIAYKRDLDKSKTFSEAFRAIRSYYISNRKYPINLQVLVQSQNLSTAALAFNYALMPGGDDFQLSALFETGDAVDAIKKYSDAGTTISDKRVTLTKNAYAYFYLPSTPPQPAIASLFDMSDELSYIPADFGFDATFSGSSVKTSDANTDGKVHLAAAVNAGDLNMAIEGEIRKVSDNLYAELIKAPSYGLDVSKFKNKWITITPADMATYGEGLVDSSPGEVQKQMTEAKQKAVDGIRLFLTVADQHQALKVSNGPTKESVNGVSAYRYELVFNKATLPDFYSDLTTQFKAKYEKDNPIKFDQATLDYLKSPQFSQIYDYFSNNTTLSLWADSKGIPLKFEYGLRLVPSAKAKNADQQIKFTATLSLSDVNTPITIDIPSPTMSVEDLTIIMSGKTREQYDYGKQSSAVSTVRSALSQYKSLAGVYPD